MYRWVRQHYQFQLRGRRFLEAPWSGGLVLLFSVAVAMLLANLPWTAEYYQRVLNIDIALVVFMDATMKSRFLFLRISLELCRIKTI